MKKISALVIAMCFSFLGGTLLSEDNVEIFGKIDPALEYVIKQREEIKREIVAGLENVSAEKSEFSIQEAIPLTGDWLFIRGGSFAMCSDDIAFMALFHPKKNIIRFLFAERTGTVEGGLFLIDRGKEKIIVGHECLGTKPPERYVLEKGIPMKDRPFNQAFKKAFSDLKKKFKENEFIYLSRQFSFDPHRNFFLSIKVFSNLGEEKTAFDLLLEEGYGPPTVKIIKKQKPVFRVGRD